MDRSRKRGRSPNDDFDYPDPDASYRSRWDRAPVGGSSGGGGGASGSSSHHTERQRRRAQLDPDRDRYRQRAGSPGYEAWLDEQEAIVHEHERLHSVAHPGGADDGDWADERERRGRDGRSSYRDGGDRVGFSPSSRRLMERAGSSSGSGVDRYVPAHGVPLEAEQGSRRRYDELDSRESGKPRDPLDEENLLNFKAFCAFVRAHDPNINRETTTAELYEKHQAYKREYNRRAIERFWREHRHEAWFQERYSLEDDLVSARKKRRRKGREGRKERWLQELRSGRLDPITFDAEDAPSNALQHRSISNENASTSKATAEDEADVSAAGSSSADVKRERAADSNAETSAGRRPTEAGLSPIIQDLTFKRHGISPTADKDLISIPPETTQILLVNLPTTLARKDVDAVFEGEPGFQYAAYGEVNALKRWSRIAWVRFDEGTDVKDIVKRLDKSQAGDVTLNMSVADRAATGRRRVTPEYANSIERLTKDLNQAKKIVAAFEAEDRELFADDSRDDVNASSATYEIEKRCQTLGLGMDTLGGDGEASDANVEHRREVLKKHLDLHLDLLRVAYHCDYYLGALCDFPEELVRRVPRHVRKQPAPGVNIESPRDHTNDESWAKMVDSKANLLIDASAVDVEEYGGKNVDKMLVNAAEPYVLEENPEKFRCSVMLPTGAVCNKAFKTALFVQKHVVNKHRPAVLDPLVGEEVKEAMELNQLALDPSRVQLARIADNSAHGNGLGNSYSSSSGRMTGSNGASNGKFMNGVNMPYGLPAATPTVAPGLQQMAAFAALQFGMPMNPSMIAAMAAAGMKEMARNAGDSAALSSSGPSGGSLAASNGISLPIHLASSLPVGSGGGGGGASGSLTSGSGLRGSIGAAPRSGSTATVPFAAGAGLPARPQVDRPRAIDADHASSDGAMPPSKRVAVERLPTPPSGPDPRARRSQRSYEDLDGAASGGGDIQLQY